MPEDDGNDEKKRRGPFVKGAKKRPGKSTFGAKSPRGSFAPKSPGGFKAKGSFSKGGPGGFDSRPPRDGAKKRTGGFGGPKRQAGPGDAERPAKRWSKQASGPADGRAAGDAPRFRKPFEPGSKKFAAKKFGAKKFAGPRDGARQDRGAGFEARGERGPRGDRPFAKAPFEKKEFGKKPFGKKAFGEKSFADGAAEKPAFAKPFGKKPFGKKPFEKRPFAKTGGEEGGEQRPFERKGFGKPAFGKPAFGKPAFEKKAFDKSPSEKRPFEKKPFDKDAGDKPFAKRPWTPGPRDEQPAASETPLFRPQTGEAFLPPVREPRGPFGAKGYRSKPFGKGKPGDDRPPRREFDKGPGGGFNKFGKTEGASGMEGTGDTSSVAPARRAAYQILHQVEEGAHSTDLLHERTGHLDARDRGLATELVLGSLRLQQQLDFLIRHFAGREPTAATGVRIALRLGVYQLRYLDRVPAHAAVDESVELARAAGGDGPAAFVNAVLRKVDRSDVRWPDRGTAMSLPSWMLRRWDARFGVETANGIGAAAMLAPGTYIRVPRGATPPEGAEATEIAGCYKAEAGAGGYRIQDIGSQAIVPLLELRSGQRYLDLCAAPGGKFLQALETPGLKAVACDASWRRLQEVESDARCVVDAARTLPFSTRFDRILLDAPCSGTGTLGRNPEIRWRLVPNDLKRYHERQVRMLTEALKALAPGGRLVYSTCSLEAEENEEVVQRIAEDFRGRIDVEHAVRRIPGRDAGDGFYAAVLASKSAR
jgi:16S rRNA (cytosine967-C5)-methyltransferase